MNEDVKFDAKIKEKEIIDILNEMKSEKLKKLGFTDLLIETTIKNNYGEIHKRMGSVDGWKTEIEDIIDKTSFKTYRDRLNNVSLENTCIKDNILTITYENNKKASFDIDYITKVFIMKQNDEKIY